MPFDESTNAFCLKHLPAFYGLSEVHFLFLPFTSLLAFAGGFAFPRGCLNFLNIPFLYIYLTGSDGYKFIIAQTRLVLLLPIANNN